MNIRKLKLNLVNFGLIATGALLLSTAVFAKGGTGGGGGVVWQCERGSQIETYLADVAEVEMKDPHAMIFKILADWSGERYEVKILNLESRGLGDAVKTRISKLKFQSTTKKLDLLNDDKLPLEMTLNGLHCTKAQLAVQDFSKGKVIYNSDIYAALSPADQLLFKFHEALVSLQEKQFGNTAPIRAELLAAANENLLGTVIKKNNLWFRCVNNNCVQIADPLEGTPDVFLAEPPNDVETEKVAPTHLDRPNYTCERGSGSYWLCGEDPPCEYEYGYTCTGKPGTKRMQCPNGCSSAIVNGVEINPAPDQFFYIPADQVDKLDTPMREFP